MSLLTRASEGTARPMHRKLLATTLALVIVGTFSFFTAAQAATIKKDVQVNSPLQDVQTKISSNSAPLEKTLIKPTPSKSPVKKVAKAPTPSPTPTSAPVETPAPTPVPTVVPVVQPVVEPVQPVQPIPVAPTSCGDNQYAAYIYGMESGGKVPGNCNPTAQNAGGCLGIGQACPGAKLTAVCPNLDYACENAFFTAYALNRYGSWAGAYEFWVAHNWW